MGPELSSGGRTPGWFYYVILNALLVVGGVPGAFFIMLAINAMAMLLSDESPYKYFGALISVSNYLDGLVLLH